MKNNSDSWGYIEWLQHMSHRSSRRKNWREEWISYPLKKKKEMTEDFLIKTSEHHMYWAREQWLCIDRSWEVCPIIQPNWGYLQMLEIRSYFSKDTLFSSFKHENSLKNLQISNYNFKLCIYFTAIPKCKWGSKFQTCCAISI